VNSDDPEYRLLGNPSFDILVVTVGSMEPGPFTNENPPKGSVKVDEVLRGDEKPGSTYVTTWKREKPPAPGDRLIIFCAGISEYSPIIWAQASYRYSVETRNLVFANMAAPERKGKIQAAAFLAILGMPGACLSMGVLSRTASLTRKARRRARVATFLMLLTAPAVYFFYESGISNHSYMRIDLFILLPALALTFLIAVPFLCSPPLTEDLA
jgi:hypothetical protein